MTEKQIAHTPGPWMAAGKPSSVVGWPVVGPIGRSICSVSWMPQKAYPNVSDADYAGFYLECEANSRLIAAAPDLLDAAKLFTKAAHDVRDELNRRGIACPASIALAAEKARAALSKAGAE